MKVSWDDEIPNIWKNKIHVPNHQPVDAVDVEKNTMNVKKNRDLHCNMNKRGGSSIHEILAWWIYVS